MKIKAIEDTLDRYFPDPKFPLDYSNLFTLTIAVLLSSQTTDLKVNEATKKLFALATAPEEMVKLKKERIADLIHGLGLKNVKAKAILELSAILIRKYKGTVPKSYKALKALPGIGPKCAAVIMAQGFGKPAFPVDTHVKRLAIRWGLTKHIDPCDIERDLKKRFKKKNWLKVHLQMINFGREFCKARGHEAKSCPICSEL